MSKTLPPMPGNHLAMPQRIASPTQFQAAQLHDLFDTLFDVHSESFQTLTLSLQNAINHKSVADALYLQCYVARVKNCLAPHAELLLELSEYFHAVSQQDEKEVQPC